MPFPTTPVVPNTTNELNVVVVEPKVTSTPQRPVQHLPEENCLRLLRNNRRLPAENHAPTGAPTQGPTRFPWTAPHHCTQRGQRGQGESQVGSGASRTGVWTIPAHKSPSLYQPLQEGKPKPSFLASANLVGRFSSPRRGKTRTGGCRSCTFLVWFLLATTVLMVDVVHAVFTPADSAALKAAVGTCIWSGCTGGCLGETTDGSCPIFIASDDGTGNPYGLIGDWDVSAVTDLSNSKCTLSPFFLCIF